MPAGLEVFNPDGGFLIDGNYKNYSLVRTGTGTGTVFYSGYELVVTHSSTGEFPPILAVSSVLLVCVSGPTNSGPNQYTWRIICYSGVFTADWYIFEEPPPTGDTFGMQVFDNDQNLVFDATFPYMRPIDLILDSNGNNFPQPKTKTYEGVSKLAFFQNTMAVGKGCYQFPDWPPVMRNVNYFYGASVNGNVLSMAQTSSTRQQSGFCGMQGIKPDSSITVIDVSGM